MNVKKMELYNILSCIQEMDDLQFDCIVNEYGENIVYDVIKILIKALALISSSNDYY